MEYSKDIVRRKTISAEVVFKLYDSYGLPIEIVREYTKNRGFL